MLYKDDEPKLLVYRYLLNGTIWTWIAGTGVGIYWEGTEGDIYWEGTEGEIY